MDIDKNKDEVSPDFPQHAGNQYVAGLEAGREAERVRWNEQYAKDPKVQRRIRIGGVVMSVISLLFLLPGLGYLMGAPERIANFPTEIPPTEYFPNLYELDIDSAPMMGVLVLFAAVGLICGIARVKRGQRSGGLVTIGVFFGFFISMVIAMNVTENIKEPILESLHSNQHVWAEERYGITYDEITVGVHGTSRNKTYFQDEVIEDGVVIARICEREDGTIMFCGATSIREMPVLVD